MGTDYRRLDVLWSAPGPTGVSHSSAEQRCATSGHDQPNLLVTFEVV